jgi:hydrogenase-4 component B
MWLLAAPCMVLGIAPGMMLDPLALLSQSLIPGAGVPEIVTSLPVILPWIALAVFVTLGLVALVKVKRRVTATWACGLPGLTERMQYTSTAFSKPVRFVFSVIYKPQRRLEILPAENTYFPTSISYSSVRTTSYEKYLYRPITDGVVALATQLRRMQSGNIQVYLLNIFLALILLLAVVGLFR